MGGGAFGVDFEEEFPGFAADFLILIGEKFFESQRPSSVCFLQRSEKSERFDTGVFRKFFAF